MKILQMAAWLTSATMCACLLAFIGVPPVLQPSTQPMLCAPQHSQLHLQTASKHKDFDWMAYFQNYPELLEPPTSLAYAEEAAWQHFRLFGRVEGRIAARLHLRLRYATAGGLTNQLLCHLAAFMIAREIGAELVLAPVLSRDAFKKGKQTWKWEPSESVFDVEKMARVWEHRGLIIHKTPEFTGRQKQEWLELLALKQPVTAVYSNDSCISMRLQRPASHLATIAQQSRQQAVEAAEAEYKNSKTIPRCINLDASALFFAAPVENDLSLAISTSHGGFFFNQTLLETAHRIVDQIRGPFSAVHLRLEDDAIVFNHRFGGAEGVLQLYLQAMANSTFTNQTTVFVASGLKLDSNTTRSKAVVEALYGAGVAKQIVYKERFLSVELIRSLHSEQLALIDGLVSASAATFLGHPMSTLSVLVEQMRACHGTPPSASTFIHIEGEAANSNAERFRAFVRFALGYKPSFSL